MLPSMMQVARELVRDKRASVLFICVRNSARSQIAQALFNAKCAPGLYAESAGLEPGEINPLAIATMRELGIDISGNGSQGCFDLFKAGRFFSHVITVCDEASAERCPIFPGIVRRQHWSIPDPAALTGTWEERLAAVRRIRETIAEHVDALCREICDLDTPRNRQHA